MNSSEKNEFSKNYVILKPKDATLLDLFVFILPSGFTKITNLIDCPDGEEESYRNFGNRWVIFISILLYKFLLAIANSLEILLAFLEKLLNFVSFNGGVRGLLLKSIRGELWTVPEKNFSTEFITAVKDSSTEFIPAVKDSSTEFIPAVKNSSTEFIPAVRCRDWRIMDLNDSTINNLSEFEIFRYYGVLTMVASKLAYQNYSILSSVVKGCWQRNLLGCYKFRNDFEDKATTHAFMFQNTTIDPNTTVVAFRGTSPFEAYDWIVDFNLSWYNMEGIGRIHSGFMKALGLQKDKGWPKDLPKSKFKHNFAYYTLRQKLRDIAESNNKAKFIITGHSMGGALATLFVTILAHHHESAVLEKLQAVYTYGRPRLGDQQFAKFMVNTVQKYDIKYYRYVYSFDLVTRLPFDGTPFTYKHFGGCIYFNGCYNGKFVKEQPDKNYFSPMWVIPKYLTAWWELIRSLIIIPLVKDSDYVEDFVTILFRVFGLLIPGISAHICPNYVNSTRLGKIQELDFIETLISVDNIKDD